MDHFVKSVYMIHKWTVMHMIVDTQVDHWLIGSVCVIQMDPWWCTWCGNGVYDVKFNFCLLVDDSKFNFFASGYQWVWMCARSCQKPKWKSCNCWVGPFCTIKASSPLRCSTDLLKINVCACELSSRLSQFLCPLTLTQWMCVCCPLPKMAGGLKWCDLWTWPKVSLDLCVVHS